MVLNDDADPEFVPDPPYVHLLVIDRTQMIIRDAGLDIPSRAGLTGGFGFFGGIAQVRLVIPPSPPP
jgi:hypothetical protein